MLPSRVSIKSYLRIWSLPFGIVLVGLCAAVMISNSIQVFALPQMTGVFLKLRMHSFLQKIHEVHTKDGKFAYFWGASEIESGLDTSIVNALFSDQHSSLRAVNVGMRSIHPVVYRAFADRVATELEKDGKRIEISFVKFPGNKLTTTYFEHYRIKDVDDQLGPVLRPNYFDFAISQPFAYFSGILHHYLLFDASLNVPSELLKEYLISLDPNPEIKALVTYFKIWNDRQFLESEVWRSDLLGTYNFNLPESRPVFTRAILDKKENAVRYASYMYFEKCCGISSLNFDPELLKEFVKMIKILKNVSNKVYIYTIPEEADFNLWRKNNYGVKTQKTLEKIAAETGVEIVNMDLKANLPDDAYLDFLHLSHEGQKTFYKLLLDEVKLEQ